MKFEDCFVAAIGISFDHHHVVVVEEAHYQALIHLDVGLRPLCRYGLTEGLITK
jgi:hypothetical protein